MKKAIKEKKMYKVIVKESDNTLETIVLKKNMIQKKIFSKISEAD